ncbi:MAG: membrane protein insertase YidC, partial [Alistipes sp.]|nr:membrane protein insertase YidC [Alistipes sp.]
MDKKSIIGIAAIALLFVGFTWFNSYEQKKYQRKLAAWQAQQDSIAAAQQPEVPALEAEAEADSSAAE